MIDLRKNKTEKINFGIYNLIFYKAKDEQGSIDFAKDCIKNNISFEFLNNTEFYLGIFDEDDFLKKQTILGNDIINKNNLI